MELAQSESSPLIKIHSKRLIPTIGNIGTHLPSVDPLSAAAAESSPTVQNHQKQQQQQQQEKKPPSTQSRPRPQTQPPVPSAQEPSAAKTPRATPTRSHPRERIRSKSTERQSSGKTAKKTRSSIRRYKVEKPSPPSKSSPTKEYKRKVNKGTTRLKKQHSRYTVYKTLECNKRLCTARIGSIVKILSIKKEDFISAQCKHPCTNVYTIKTSDDLVLIASGEGTCSCVIEV